MPNVRITQTHPNHYIHLGTHEADFSWDLDLPGDTSVLVGWEVISAGISDGELARGQH